MKRYNDDDLALTIETLQSRDPDELGSALRIIHGERFIDARLRLSLELLLDNDEFCLYRIPYLWGEIRLTAAAYLVKIARIKQEPITIELKNISFPFNNQCDVAGLALEHKIVSRRAPGPSSTADIMTQLKRLNQLPVRDLVLNQEFDLNLS